MKLEMSFAVVGPWRDGLSVPQLPMDLSLTPHGSYRLSTGFGRAVEGANAAMEMVATRAVDPRHISAVQDMFRVGPDDTSGPRTALASPEVYELADGASRIGGALSFAVGVALSVMSASGGGRPSHYVAESPEDQALLDRLGTSVVRLPLVASTHIEVSDHSPVDAELIQELAQRGATALYDDVLGATTQVAKFRELWRVLELAFQAHGTQLIDLLAGYPPAIELGFDRPELHLFLVLRGKVSHAAARDGTWGIARVEEEVIDSIGRLWSLVDRVLLTKKESSRSLDVDELRPLVAYIGRDGTTHFTMDVDDREGWLRFYGDWSTRFRQPER